MSKSIGRYEIREELGRGGMAAVYLAVDPRLDREVALKLMDQQLTGDPAFAARFEREAKTVASIEHSAVVSLYDYGEADGWLYLVMRFMKGGSLKEQISKGPMTLDKAYNVVQRIGSALDKAHSMGMIHRDLKPANILLDEDQEPYLSDFGIVKVAKGDSDFLTETGKTLGTFAYMSPEQLLDKELDGRSDIYALGIVLYEMLTGKHPFGGSATTSAAMAIAHTQEPVPDVTKDNPTLPPALREVIQKAMAKDANLRYTTGREMAEALQAAMTGDPSVAATAAAAVAAATVVEPSPTVVEKASLPPPQPVIRQPAAQPPIQQPPPPPQAPPQAVQPQAPEKRQIPMWIFAVVGVVGLVCIGAAIVAGIILLGSGPTSPTTPTPPTATPMPTVTATDEPDQPIVSDPATPTSTPSPTPETPDPEQEPDPPTTAASLPAEHLGQDGLLMRLVPEGEFIMGSTRSQVEDAVDLCRNNQDNDPCNFNEFANEIPQHSVFVSDFYMDVTEITNEQYRACVDSGACDLPEAGTGRYSRQDYYDDLRFAGYPVIWVSWFDAQDYCTWAGERLPTEAEWEKAARGEGGLLFPWGDTFDGNKANTEELGGNRLRPVGSYPTGAGPYGILDQAGSVWEWVADWYGEDYYDASPDSDPLGPSLGRSRILRGGSYGNFQYYARTTNRGARSPDSSTEFRGFRCAIDAPG